MTCSSRRARVRKHVDLVSQRKSHLSEGFPVPDVFSVVQCCGVVLHQHSIAVQVGAWYLSGDASAHLVI